MTKYIVQRILALLLTLFTILSLSFVFMRLVPGGPAGETAHPDVQLAVARRFHLDRPLPEQYVIFLRNFLRFDFGVSMNLLPRKPVFEIIAERAPRTIQLNLLSLALTVPVGIALGIISALKKNSLIDHLVSVSVIINVSLPSFIFAVLMQYFLAFQLRWFPPLFDLSPGFSWAHFHSMILPILALSFGGIAVISRYMRAELFEALNSEYMLLSKAKGLTQVQSTMRHALRNSFVPLCNIILPMFFGILGGSMVIENIFSIPGLGTLMVHAISASDYYVAMAAIFVFGIIALVSNLVVDLSYGVIDPRIRMGGGKVRG